MHIDSEDPIGPDLIGSIRSGDLAGVTRLLVQHPGLAGARLMIAKGRTPLHVVTDWPGYYPDGPAIARALINAGADPNVRGEGEKAETPLHWAASSDDVDIADVLIDAGADIEAADGSIGTPLDNAIGYGCWHVARLLAERGAVVNKLWHAGALGDLRRLTELMNGDPGPTTEDIDSAFWQACHGGQLRAADLLLRMGANIHAVPDYAQGGSILDIATNPDTRRTQLGTWLTEHGAAPPAA